MSPAIMRFKSFVIGFGSNGESRAHVRVYRKGQPRSYTKIWLDKEATVAHNDADLSAAELKEARNIVLANREMLVTSWYDHFGQ